MGTVSGPAGCLSILLVSRLKERERENMSLIFSSLFLGDGEPLGVSQLEILVDSPAVK
jgi:hypothetical protein